MKSEAELSAETVFILAERESGAYGLADDGLRQRVGAMVNWINERGPYSVDQNRAMQGQLQRLLVRRLRLLMDRARYPAIAEEKIERPIFVIGFARSGTTLFHSLLAEDPEALALQSWHVYSPSPPPGAGPVVAERIAYAQRQVEAWMDFCPGQKSMHPYIDKGAYQLLEDEETYVLDFRNAYPYHYYHVPVLTPMVVLSGDQVAAYRFHRELLQQLQWNTGKRQWVCKGPSHQNSLDALFEVYPDALCVWVHRPVGDILASITALSGLVYDTIQGKPGDVVADARAIAISMKAGFDAMIQNALIDDPRLIHIKFKELTGDPLAVIRKVLAQQERSVGPEFEARVKAWLADPENAVDRYGRYPYSYEALGLKREWVEELFTDYSKRFGLN